MAFRIPNESERVTVMGMTGGGKTQGASFVLSRMDTTTRPWVLLDFKREALFDEFEPFDLPDFRPPRDPGLYRRRVSAYDVLNGDVDNLLNEIHSEGNCGIFVDEGMALEQSLAFQTVLTQGRSLQIPMIVCSQRPKKIPIAAFSEANFFMIYNLTHPDDKKLAANYVGQTKPLKRLPRYHFYWYDVVEDKLLICRPVPDRLDIARVIATKQLSLVKQQKARVYL